MVGGVVGVRSEVGKGSVCVGGGGGGRGCGFFLLRLNIPKLALCATLDPL